MATQVYTTGGGAGVEGVPAHETEIWVWPSLS